MKPLHNKGATPERKNHSTIKTYIAGTTDGGIPNAYCHVDVEHCALDKLLAGGFIEKEQYDAGMDLRKLYYTFARSGVSCCEERSGGHEGDFETDADRAYERHRDALRAVDAEYRALVQSICCEATDIPAMYGLTMSIQHGLDDLMRFFTRRK